MQAPPPVRRCRIAFGEDQALTGQFMARSGIIPSYRMLGIGVVLGRAFRNAIREVAENSEAVCEAGRHPYLPRAAG